MPAHFGDQHHLRIPIPSDPRDEVCVMSTLLSLHTKMCVRADLAREQTPVAFQVACQAWAQGLQLQSWPVQGLLHAQNISNNPPRAPILAHGGKASRVKAWPLEGRQCLYWEQACPPSTGCPNKNPTEETIEDSKWPKKKGRGQGISKSYSLLLLGQPGTQVQSRRSPFSLSGPTCPLHAKRGTEAQGTEIRARPASTLLCH